MSPPSISTARLEIAIAVVEHDGRYLIGVRPEGAPLAGLWEFPGGKIRSGESAEQAAVRECLEEAGLAARVTGEYPSTSYDYDHARVLLHFFACAMVEQCKPLPARFRWVSARDLVAYSFPPANAALIRHIANGVAAS